jgi:hypothetical protein
VQTAINLRVIVYPALGSRVEMRVDAAAYDRQKERNSDLAPEPRAALQLSGLAHGLGQRGVAVGFQHVGSVQAVALFLVLAELALADQRGQRDL